MEQTFDEGLNNVTVDGEQLKAKAKEKFDKTILSLNKEEFKILTRYKIENKESIKEIALVTGLSAALIVFGGVAGAIIPDPFGEMARIAACLEATGFIGGNFKIIGELIENKLLSAFARRDLKRKGIEFRWKGMNLRIKDGDEYIEFDNSENVEEVLNELKREKEDREWKEAMSQHSR